MVDGLAMADLPAQEVPLSRQQYQQPFGACGMASAGRGVRQTQPGVEMMKRLVASATTLNRQSVGGPLARPLDA